MKLSFQIKTIIKAAMMVFCFTMLHAQERSYTVSIHGSITTSSRLFFNPYDADEISRNQSLPINGVWGIGIDFRRTLKGNSLYIGLSAEYLKVRERLEIQDSNGAIVIADDGYVAFPVELTGYFCIPFNSESFRMYMGGGVGAYFGERLYAYASFVSQVVERKPGFGIHVLSGFEVDLLPFLVLRSEVKFREVQFESTNVFPQPTYVSGTPLPNDNLPFRSRISIDGILVNAGIAYRF
ncbi:MAG: hypothetical protein EPO24_09785 [Bacteroidetes bacterium]|nr:MAG: hypothetical protein EPO24_09785 [Bacteroidota bacterium]